MFSRINCSCAVLFGARCSKITVVVLYSLVPDVAELTVVVLYSLVPDVAK